MVERSFDAKPKDKSKLEERKNFIIETEVKCKKTGRLNYTF
jgi:hypothetical protein